MVKKKYNLILSVESKNYRMTIGLDVVRILGCPQYTTFKVKKDMSYLTIYPCKEKEEPSFKVPDKFFIHEHCSYRINSKSFVSGLYTTNQLDEQKNYYFIGIYSKDKNAVIFDMKDSKMKNVSDT